MTIEEIYIALQQAHPADLLVIRHYVAWVGFRRRMHTRFYFHAHWVKSNEESFPSIAKPALPITHERRRAHRVKFNAHWMNG